jgi:hypothetical protein
MDQTMIELFEKDLNDILPDEIYPEYVQNVTLIVKLKQLRIEIVNLSKDMINKSRKNVTLN